ncbi:hypothetical protein BC940DRAFT_348275 [Gongronella butleri]|nr:hypothetical protein BC940DRAFT_348275 [Gongronella butleri]
MDASPLFIDPIPFSFFFFLFFFLHLFLPHFPLFLKINFTQPCHLLMVSKLAHTKALTARTDSQGNAITRMHSSMKRPRAPIACIRCHHKKVRCDGEQPNCSRCAQSGILCAYPANRRSRNAQTTSVDPFVNNLSRLGMKIKQIESDLDTQRRWFAALESSHHLDGMPMSLAPPPPPTSSAGGMLTASPTPMNEPIPSVSTSSHASSSRGGSVCVTPSPSTSTSSATSTRVNGKMGKMGKRLYKSRANKKKDSVSSASTLSSLDFFLPGDPAYYGPPTPSSSDWAMAAEFYPGYLAVQNANYTHPPQQHYPQQQPTPAQTPAASQAMPVDFLSQSSLMTTPDYTDDPASYPHTPALAPSMSLTPDASVRSFQKQLGYNVVDMQMYNNMVVDDLMSLDSSQNILDAAVWNC